MYGLFSALFCLYKVDSKNKFISFLNLFNFNDFLKNVRFKYLNLTF